MLRICRYEPKDKALWDDFISKSKNGTFLFRRDYMDYHSDRFADCSLMFWKGEELLAVMPANIRGDTFISHEGLTYGGLISDSRLTMADTIETFELTNRWLRQNTNVKKVVYKPVPYIYCSLPSEEDLYVILQRCGARIIARDISSTIAMDCAPKWHRDRKYGAHKALREGVEVGQSSDFKGFWKVLTDNLRNTYGVAPVHSLEEMLLLKSRFPANIVLYTATLDGEVLGGTVLYISRQVVHAQYISASAKGKHLRVIDAIYDQILNYDFEDVRYFDFGKSTERGGSFLNDTLIYQKEGFGGRGVCYDTYQWDVYDD